MKPVPEKRRFLIAAGALLAALPLPSPAQSRTKRVAFFSEGRMLTHRQILQEVWGPGRTEAHYVRVHMASLRRKIEVDPARPRLLITEPGVGYRLRET